MCTYVGSHCKISPDNGWANVVLHSRDNNPTVFVTFDAMRKPGEERGNKTSRGMRAGEELKESNNFYLQEDFGNFSYIILKRKSTLIAMAPAFSTTSNTAKDKM